MDKVRTLTLKTQINEVKVRLLKLGMTIEDGVYKRSDLQQEVTKCINDLEAMDDSIKLSD